MSLRRINPPGLAPAVGFSHAVVSEGGRTIYLAGQTALDERGEIVGRTLAEQVQRVLLNLLTALDAAGGGPQHIVRLTMYVTNLGDYRRHAEEIGVVWRRLMGREYPAMALVEVRRLWDVDAMVEIEGVAVLP